MTINLIEIAVMAQKNMRKETAFVAGVLVAMEHLREIKTYNGTPKQCIQYLNSKITMASINAINNPAHIGSIALYSAMITVLYYVKEVK